MARRTTLDKEVRDRIKGHVLEFYSVGELCQEVKNLMKYNRHECPTEYKAILYMAKSGCFLVYYNQVSDFLNGLGINPDGKQYSDEKSWELYCHLVARDGVYWLH